MVTLPEVAQRIDVSVRYLQVEKARTDKRRREGKPGRFDLPPSEGRAPLPEPFRSPVKHARNTSVAWRRSTIDPWIANRLQRTGKA